MNNAFKYYEFSEIADIYNGNSISKKEKEENYLGLKDGTPYIATKDVGFDHLINYENGVSIPKSKWNEFRVAPEKSVFVCSEGGSAGRKIAYNERDVHFGNKLYAIVPKDTVVAKYLYYYVLSKEFKDSFFGQMTGLIGGVSLKKFKTIKVPVPHISKQKQLISILDEAFNGIDTAIANTEKNLANARELFESYLNSVFSQRNAQWEQKTLGEVCENLDSKRIPITKSKRKSGRIPYYGASGVVDHVDDYIFDEDLLLVSEDGANLLARTYPIAFSISGKTWVNNHAHVLRFKNMFSQKFIEYFMNSISLVPYVSGMAQPKLNQRSLNSIQVPFPADEIKRSVVERLDELSMEVERLEAIYKQKVELLIELKQTLLQKAFSGELTSDNKLMDETEV